MTRLWTSALALAVFTVLYNLAEGVVAVHFGVQDDALTLFGFGIDSFIEVISGAGIIAMVVRIRANPDTPRSRFERAALRVTGTAFYLLAFGLAATAAYNVAIGHRPDTTLPGVVIALVSLAFMWVLVWGKRRVGRALNSAPILADANCSLVCLYMSLVLLISSGIYLLTGFPYADTLGAAGLIYFAVGEGREAFEKATGMACCCEDGCHGE
jgi:divalent metal cation (Fe/Co/Zn/Cd) transporter